MKYLMVSLLIFTAYGCDRSGPTNQPPVDIRFSDAPTKEEPTEVIPDERSTELQILDWNAQMEESGEWVIRNAEDPDLQALDIATQGIDFSTNDVVAVSAGQQTSGGFHLQILNIVRHDDQNATIHTRLTEPGPNCMSTMALTYPVAAVVVPSLPENVQFKHERLAKDCL